MSTVVRLNDGSATRAEMRESRSSSTRFGNLLCRRERWGLSWRGWFVMVLALCIGSLLIATNAYRFLAVTERVNSRTLVVEGWVHEYAIQAAAKEFRAGSYDLIFTTGGPVVGKGGYINDYNTSASVGAELLKKTNIPGEKVQMVPSRVIGRDRTYNSAVALRNWFAEHNLHVNSINVVTEDVHARRTRLLFAEAFGPHVSLGIIAVPNVDYDAKHWWQYSEAVEHVIGESVAYVYAKCFFYPGGRFAKDAR
jgi:uncharacterized SAM-binding protein YcdF (DUF218 family)